MHELYDALRDAVLSPAVTTNAIQAVNDLRQHIEAGTITVTTSRHVLGFIHLKICDTPDYSLRLHLWPAEGLDPAPPVWKVHSHIAELTSLVLCGGVTNNLYRVSLDENGASQLYRVEYDNKSSRRVKTDVKIKCDLTEKSLYLPGDSYYIPHEAYHSSEHLEGEFSATLVVMGKPALSSVRVVGSIDGEENYTYEQQSLAVDRVIPLLRCIR